MLKSKEEYVYSPGLGPQQRQERFRKSIHDCAASRHSFNSAQTSTSSRSQTKITYALPQALYLNLAFFYFLGLPFTHI